MVGFLVRHSTCTNLLETVNDWTIALRNHNKTDAIYIDFQQAFDSVSHPIESVLSHSESRVSEITHCTPPNFAITSQGDKLRH